MCFGDANGVIELDVIGDYPPYLFAINEVSTPERRFEGLQAGNYQITITNRQNCETLVDLSITDPELFELSLSLTDTTVVLGEDLDIEIESNYVINSLSWSPDSISPCGNCDMFNFLPLSSEKHTVTATNAHDCIAMDMFQVNINIEDLKIYIPNIFDTSASGLDSEFTVGAKDGLISRVVDFSVYDRWGNLIHQVNDTGKLNLWDGRYNGQKVNPGVYVYLLELELLDGKQYSFSGDLFLLD